MCHLCRFTGYFRKEKMSRLNLKKNASFKPTASAGGLLVFCWLIIFAAAAAAAEMPPLAETVARLQQIYERTEDFQASFVQETTVKSIRKTEVEEGVVYFKNPRQMLWDYQKPKAKKLIINAQKAWLYLPQDKTVYTQDADRIFKSEALIRFLSGLGKLTEDFTIRYAAPAATDRKGHYLLQLYPREKGASYAYLQVTLDKNSFQILEVSFDDVMGNTTRLKFSAIKMNAGLSAKMFQFQPPSGTSIFKMP